MDKVDYLINTNEYSISGVLKKFNGKSFIYDNVINVIRYSRELPHVIHRVDCGDYWRYFLGGKEYVYNDLFIVSL